MSEMIRIGDVPETVTNVNRAVTKRKSISATGSVMPRTADSALKSANVC